jgi:hypothetical protein
MATISKAVAFLICLTVSVLSIGVQAKQTAAATWVAKSGLHSFFAGHVVRFTVFEAGPAPVPSTVLVQFVDRNNRVVAEKRAVLKSESHMQLDLRVGENAGLVPLRVVMTVENASGQFTALLTTFEDITPRGDVFTLPPTCGPGSGHIDGQAMCIGWYNITSGQ